MVLWTISITLNRWSHFSTASLDQKCRRKTSTRVMIAFVYCVKLFGTLSICVASLDLDLFPIAWFCVVLFICFALFCLFICSIWNSSFVWLFMYVMWTVQVTTHIWFWCVSEEGGWCVDFDVCLRKVVDVFPKWKNSGFCFCFPQNNLGFIFQTLRILNESLTQWKTGPREEKHQYVFLMTK